jgi:acyl-coenzyme A synthetase/AMP-(fatty) acid ligase
MTGSLGSRAVVGVNNVQIQVVDEHLAPVALGAPGEIVFSGVCVGRGYINDPERTRAAFLTDPDGQRRYRSGDHGRWRPDGKLEFLGRRDTQLKIRGFRIELGEIENTLLRVPGVRDGAVVVAERTDQSKHLVAFYSSPQPLDSTPS